MDLNSLKLTKSTEDYLEAMYILKENKGIIRVTDIAEKLNVKPPSVVEAVNKILKLGLATRKKYGEIELKMVTVNAENIDLKSRVRVKYLKRDKNEVISLKAEYEDIKPIASELSSKGIKIPLSKLKTIIEAKAYKNVLKDGKITITVD